MPAFRGSRPLHRANPDPEPTERWRTIAAPFSARTQLFITMKSLPFHYADAIAFALDTPAESSREFYSPRLYRYVHGMPPVGRSSPARFSECRAQRRSRHQSAHRAPQGAHQVRRFTSMRRDSGWLAPPRYGLPDVTKIGVRLVGVGVDRDSFVPRTHAGP